MEALELSSAERGVFLDEHCAGDPELRKRVELLIGHDESNDSFLEKPAATPPPTLVESDPPTSIGRYRIEGVLGVGGYGRVYAAVQDTPKRRVAIKTLRTSALSAAAHARFATEIELLGRLDHPGICRIFDAGTAEAVFADGHTETTLFYAMELIAGLPVTQYAQSHDIDLEGRVTLIAHIAEAVQHAHQRGIIHRDLKPANILVQPPAQGTRASQSTDQQLLCGRPSILDFGIARLVERGEHESGMETLPGTVLGTMAYMSPEQFVGSEAVDVRSDVWALGVIAWELVIDALPFDVERSSLAAAARIVTSEEPKPLRWCGRRVDRDLETILRHALSKEPKRRYQSAAEFAADLRRFLANEAITARPATVTYQLKMFARRHRGLVAGMVFGIVALITGTIVSIVLWLDARRARDAAILARDSAQEISRFLREDLLEQANPDQAQGKELTVRELVDRAAARIEGRFGDKPLVEAELRITISRTYSGLGDVKKAELHARKALELAQLDRDVHVHLAALGALGEALHNAKGGSEALDIRRRALAIAREHLDAQNESISRAALALGDQLSMEGKLKEAEKLLREVIEDASKHLGPTHDNVMSARNNLGLVLDNSGRHDEAIQELSIVVEHRRGRAPNHPDTLTSVANLSLSYWYAGKHKKAREICEDVLARRRRILGDEHRQTLLSYNNLSLIQISQNDAKAAAKTATAALEISRRVLGEEHRDTLRLRSNLSSYLSKLGRTGEAVDHARKGMNGSRNAFAKDHWLRGWYQKALAGALHADGQHKEALVEAEAAYGQLRAALDAAHPQTAATVKLGIQIAAALDDPEAVTRWRARAK